eukprot:5478993-Alexandrium_andersonii.AAC.1
MQGLTSGGSWFDRSLASPLWADAVVAKSVCCVKLARGERSSPSQTPPSLTLSIQHSASFVCA